MFKHPEYLIREGDSFHPSAFPGIANNIDHAFASLHSQPAEHKAEMLIAWLNRENFNTSSVADNPALARKIGSGILELQDVQWLFDCCQKKPYFKKELESYISKRFDPSTLNF